VQLNRFQNTYKEDNWILCDKEDAKDKSYPAYEAKPLYVYDDAKKLLFPWGVEKIILMSATILEPELLCENIGIDTDDAEYISVDCPFPKENREIQYFPVGKMTYKKIDETLPLIVETIKDILEKHKNEKGIIHASSYKITKAIKDGIADNRLLTHTTETRHKVLEHHQTTEEPTVLLSPSMHEGIDLKDDLSRFQIVTKIPYPSLKDEQIKARLDIDSNWYQWKTCMTLIQSLGRSVRSETDYAVTYILDADFKQFYNRNKRLFPAWLNIIWS